jgi:2-polyprenyl-6-methoxyphenol hydroxylase-like FAD-dependent oxidoreductase
VRALIAGAGIGGLSAALSLHAAGFGVQVIESASALRPLGVGINLQPQAIRELTELGLGDRLAATGIETAELVHFDRHGNRIWGLRCGRHAGYHWPQYSIHRGALQMILLDAVRTRLGPDSVRTGTAFESFSDEAAGVTAHVRDRVSGAVSDLRADVLVGADGLYSAVRAQLHPAEPPPLWHSGVWLWRGLTPGMPFLGGRTVAVAGANAALKFVAYPVSREAELRGTALINWVAEVKLPPSLRTSANADWNRDGRLADVLPWFADWTFGWLDVPALLTGAGQILEYPMVDRDPLPFWGRGRVTLLGDAAHPMYPIGANGGSQAVVDAGVLAQSLAQSLAAAGSPEAGLAAYEAARRERVNLIVLANRDMPADRLLHQVSTRAPGGFDRIEDVLTAAELAAFDDAYQTTTRSDVAALNSRLSNIRTGSSSRPSQA